MNFPNYTIKFIVYLVGSILAICAAGLLVYHCFGLILNLVAIVAVVVVAAVIVVKVVGIGFLGLAFIFKEAEDAWHGDDKFNAKPLFREASTTLTVDQIFEKIVDAYTKARQARPKKKHFWCDIEPCGNLFPKDEKQKPITSKLSDQGRALVRRLESNGFSVLLDLNSWVRDGYDQSPRIRVTRS